MIATPAQNTHLVCFAAYSGPFHMPQPRVHWLLLYSQGDTGAAESQPTARQDLQTGSTAAQAPRLPSVPCPEEYYGWTLALNPTREVIQPGVGTTGVWVFPLGGVFTCLDLICTGKN